MHKISLSLFLAVGLVAATQAQNVTLPPSGDNQHATVTQWIGNLVSVTIDYHSPDVTAPNGEDRTGKIWGQLVPYGFNDLGFGLRNPAPWRAGANENTTITFSHDVQVQGQPLQAGTYGFHVVPMENEDWTLIFSNNATAWGSYFYDERDDALRVKAKPEASEPHEWLTYEFIDRQADQTTVALMWEKIKLPFTVAVPDMPQLYADNLRKELQSSAGFTWQGWNTAANYLLQQNLNLEEALQWAENAVSMPYIGEENFTTLQTKAQILSKLGRTDEAMAAMEKAIAHPTASALQVHSLGRQLLAQGQKEEALKIFQANAKKYPHTWPVNVGLARGYSAVGEYKKALKYAKMAHKEAPDQLNKDSMASAIEQLQQGKDIN
ncbi:DUF2911 domain-containing protein [Catalinimonas alkaloidigena]|nr:DUF2911 domain-containing protein [Catalinimonas alkaloidigena]